MTWSFVTVAVPTVCYVATSVLEFNKGNASGGIIFFGYALANVGFLWAFWR